MENKILGERISKLRNINGLSQEEVSEKMNISRPSLVQIEQGNRNIKAEELKLLSEILNFSMDEIMSNNFEIEDFTTQAIEKEEAMDRVAIPIENIPKFKNLILYILEKCGGKANIGETVLYKLLYFSDFNYYEIHEEHLSGAQYRKLPNGPVPKNASAILKNMEDSGELQMFKTNYYGYAQKRYLPLVHPNLKLFNGAEIDVIDKVIELLSDMSANDISRYSHEDMPWKASKEKEIIDYELVFYRTAPYSVRTYNDVDCYDED